MTDADRQRAWEDRVKEYTDIVDAPELVQPYSDAPIVEPQTVEILKGPSYTEFATNERLRGFLREGVQQDFGVNMKALGFVGMESAPNGELARSLEGAITDALKPRFVLDEVTMAPPTPDGLVQLVVRGRDRLREAGASPGFSLPEIMGRDLRREAGLAPSFAEPEIQFAPLTPADPTGREPPLVWGTQARGGDPSTLSAAEMTTLVETITQVSNDIAARTIRVQDSNWILSGSTLLRRERADRPRGPSPFEGSVREAFATFVLGNMTLGELARALFPVSPLRRDARAGFTQAGDSVLWLRMTAAHLARLVRARVLSFEKREGLPSVYTLAAR